MRFLDLPADAKAIRYWDHWHDQIAAFETTESEFRAIFPAVEFQEISEPIPYISGGYGNPDRPPFHTGNGESTSATAGIYFRRSEADGGGELILFDRERQTGYYELALW
ncbi:MAG: hypothetical protein R3F11_33335 [Verrucomicrobiales bacterium]